MLKMMAERPLTNFLNLLAHKMKEIGRQAQQSKLRTGWISDRTTTDPFLVFRAKSAFRGNVLEARRKVPFELNNAHTPAVLSQ